MFIDHLCGYPDNYRRSAYIPNSVHKLYQDVSAPPPSSQITKDDSSKVPHPSLHPYPLPSHPWP